jgi:ribosomal subunit interface protein
MRFTFNAPHLNPPTLETLQDYSQKKFSKIKKFLKKDDKSNNEIRISVNKVREIFELSVQVFGIQRVIAKVKDKDIRRSVDKACDEIKRSLAELKDKNQRSHRISTPALNFENI